MRARLVPVLLLAACGSTRVVDRDASGRPVWIRSPQPDRAHLEKLHARYGVRTVVNLRGERPGEPWFERERRAVESIGADWVHLRVSGSRAPEPETVERFLGVVGDPDRWPVLVHCQSGIHRTGVMTAIYRIRVQGWSAERAIREMEAEGFDWGARDRRDVKRYLRDLDRGCACDSFKIEGYP